MASHAPSADASTAQVTRVRLPLALPALAGALALALYVRTAAPYLTWAHDGVDGGDLITAAMTVGVPHPSGYPTYCLLSRAFALLPVGSIAGRFSLFSAVAAAIAVTLVASSALIALNLTGRSTTRAADVSCLVAALACAVAPTLWSQATIAEVYALAAAFFGLCLRLTLSELASPSLWRWALLGCVFGLALGTHLTLILSLPGLALLLWPRANLGRLSLLAAGAVAGLGVFAYLPLAAAAQPPVNWGDPRTLEGFWWLISARMYRRYAFGLPMAYLPARIAAWAGMLVRQYTPVGLVCCLLGLWSWATRGRQRVLWGTLVVYLAFSIYAILYDTADSYVYLIPAFVVAALWLAEGMRVALDALHTRFMLDKAWTAVLAAALALAMLLPGVLANYRANDLSGDGSVAEWVSSVLDGLPEHSILITSQDRHTFALSYVQWVEGRRQDLIVIDGELWTYPWYSHALARRYPALVVQHEPHSIEQLVRSNLATHRVYLASERADLAAFRAVPGGDLWELLE